MLFLLFGSAGVGKTVALDTLRRRRLPTIAIHDFDEIGVPPRADIAWRQRGNEHWLRRALDYEADRVDLVLAGQTPPGELLATPSAPLVEAISACLVDCDDETRLARLRPRGRAQLGRMDARACGRPELANGGDHAARDGVEMRWERWSDWTADDPRWRVRVLDTTTLAVGEVADELVNWIVEERALVQSGEHPLLRWAR